MEKSYTPTVTSSTDTTVHDQSDLQDFCCHAVTAIADLQKWREIEADSLEAQFLIMQSFYDDGENLDKLFKKLNIINLSEKSEKKLLSETINSHFDKMKTCCIDQTHIQNDLNSTLKTFKTVYWGNSIFNSANGKGIDTVVIENQASLADYLLNNTQFDSPAWVSKKEVIAIFAGHGTIMDGKLNLFLDTIDQMKITTIKYFPVERYWKQWLSFVVKNHNRAKSRNLVMVLDMCHSGHAVTELESWCKENWEVLNRCKCSVKLFTSCSENELSRGGYYLQVWLDTFRKLRVNFSDSADKPAINIIYNNPPYLLQQPQFFSFPSEDETVEAQNVYNALKYTAENVFENWLRLQNHSDPVESIDGFWRNKQPAEDESLAFEKGSYNVLDVRCFVSNLGPEIAAIIEGTIVEKGQKKRTWTWIQHVHMDTEQLLNNKDWKVSTKFGCRSIKAVVKNAAAENSLVSVSAPNADLKACINDVLGGKVINEVKPLNPNKDILTYEMKSSDVDAARNDIKNFGLLANVNSKIFDEGETIGKLNNSSANFALFIGKVTNLLSGDFNGRNVYISEAQTIYSVRDWLEKIRNVTNKSDLMKYWHMASSICGLSRTRVRSHDRY